MKIYESNMKIFLTVLAVFAVLIAIALCLGQNLSQMSRDKLLAEAMDLSYFKDFAMASTDGGVITEDIYKGYKVTVFNGWAPWCSACVGEMPDLSELNEEYAEKGLQIVGVVADYNSNITANPDSAYDEDIAGVLENLNMSYPSALSDAAFEMQVGPTMSNAFPCTWAVSENGDVIGIQSGGLSANKWREKFDAWLKLADEGKTEVSK